MLETNIGYNLAPLENGEKRISKKFRLLYNVYPKNNPSQAMIRNSSSSPISTTLTSGSSLTTSFYKIGRFNYCCIILDIVVFDK